MLTRILSALVGLVILFLVMFSNVIVFNIALAVISAVAAFEGLKAYGYSKNIILVILGAVTSVVLPLASYFDSRIIFATLFAVFAICIGVMLKNHREILAKDLFAIIFIVMVIPFAFSTLGYIRNGENGMYLVWLPFMAAWLTDTFAYFGGRFFGKRKLAPEISPKKTIEGSISGIIGAVIGFVVYALLLDNIWNYRVNIINFAVMSLVTSILSQMGDLLASSMKRENGVKDFGNIMPGHGGVLDRFDSLILTAPCIYICLMFIG